MCVPLVYLTVRTFTDRESSGIFAALLVLFGTNIFFVLFYCNDIQNTPLLFDISIAFKDAKWITIFLFIDSVEYVTCAISMKN